MYVPDPSLQGSRVFFVEVLLGFSHRLSYVVECSDVMPELLFLLLIVNFCCEYSVLFMSVVWVISVFFIVINYRSMSFSSISDLGTQPNRGCLGIGAVVTPKGADGIVGLILKSAADRSWVVHWYELQKTSCSKFNQLVVKRNPSRESLVEVGTLLSRKILQKPMDFSTDVQLKEYVQKVRPNLKRLKRGLMCHEAFLPLCLLLPARK